MRRVHVPARLTLRQRVLGLQRPHRVRRRQLGQQLDRAVHPNRVLVGERSTAGHQPLEYHASRPTPPRRPPNRPLKLEVCDCVGAVISPAAGQRRAAPRSIRRCRRQRGTGCWSATRDDLVVMCKTKREAEDGACGALGDPGRAGLELKQAKTRIVHLREGGEGFDFLGFHHRYVRGAPAVSAPQVPSGPLALTSGDAARPRSASGRSPRANGCCPGRSDIVAGPQPVPGRLGGLLPLRELRRFFDKISLHALEPVGDLRRQPPSA